MNKETLRTADYWSKIDCGESDKNFYCFPAIRCRSSKLIFNEQDASRRDWCEYWTVEKYLKDIIPVGKCLSICCGFGLVERIISKLGVAKEIYGIDIAPGAIAEAKRIAEVEHFNNIFYEVVDVNTFTFPKEEYDIIWANGALHHIKNIENVVKNLFDTLKPGGYLISRVCL